MSFLALVALAVGLAMDATAVAATRGLAARTLHARHVALMALLFGGFQALMPLLGYLLGERVGRYVASWDHWLAFAVLGALGGKMLWEALKREDPAGDGPGGLDPQAQDGNPFALRELLVLAVATSIDAFAVGITLPMLEAPLGLSLLTIGVVTVFTSALGAWAGHRFGRALGPRLDMVGGLLLIALGATILVQHLSAP